MNNLDKQYQNLLQDILDNGIVKGDRTGIGTKSIFGRQIRHKMEEGFPLLTTKKMYTKGIITELIWFLRGDTNIKYLVDNDCNIWNGDAYNFYKKIKANWMITKSKNSPEHLLLGTDLTMEEFILAVKTSDITDSQFGVGYRYGDLGPVYGKQWRDWCSVEWDDAYTQKHDSVHIHFDQIKMLIDDLKNNPDSRRLMVNAWNVAEINKTALPPCHYGFQCWTRELSYEERYEIHKKYITEDKLDLLFEFATNENLDKLGVPKRAISLMWNQRSVDTFLGLPFNIASYGLLLEIIAKEVNMIPDELIGNLGDTHLYLNHLDVAKEQIEKESFDLPTLIIENEVKWKEGDCLPTYSYNDFKIENYKFNPSIKAKLNN